MGMTVRDAEHPDGDIEIQFVGLRPAEKLYEELLIGSNVAGTGHPRIMRADEDCLTMDVVTDLLDQLRQASQDLDYEKARSILLTAVKEYDPKNGIDDLDLGEKDGLRRDCGIRPRHRFSGASSGNVIVTVVCIISRATRYAELRI